MKIITLLFSGLLTQIAFAQISPGLESWKQYQFNRSYELLLNNISRPDTPKGFVVASPSKFDPDYYFHWVRDAALVMAAVDKTTSDYSKKAKMFRDYIGLVRHHQSIFKLSNQGEPKFNTDGTSYQLPWGRPQNDGPALRALVLARHALELLERGEESYVRTELYQGKIPAIGVIKRDLEYVSHNWKNPDFDLWEEVKGTHFYTRYVQRAALHTGAKLARRLGDDAAAKWYEKQVDRIGETLTRHYDPQRGFILSTLDRIGGLHYKKTNIDTSVILAILHAPDNDLSFQVDDYRVINSAFTIMKSFKITYPINKDAVHNVAIGRYPEDKYFGGHPWFLLTSGMAEYFYTLSKAFASNKTYSINSNNVKTFSRILRSAVEVGSQLSSSQKRKLSKEFREMGDQLLQRVRTHVGENGRMDEQFDRISGHMKSAKHLTWSYAAYLTAFISQK